VKFVQIENDHKTELHLCQSCAQGYTNFSTGFDLQHLLSSMFQAGKLGQKLKQGPAVKTCSTCGRSLLDIQKTGRLGCGDCYQVFSDALNPVLRRLHGSSTHRGKVPARGYPKARVSRQIEDLRRRLQECVRQEQYEQAAKYRDELRLLESQVSGGDSQ
jgi:protein arginine kinase activator